MGNPMQFGVGGTGLEQSSRQMGEGAAARAGGAIGEGMGTPMTSAVGNGSIGTGTRGGYSGSGGVNCVGAAAAAPTIRLGPGDLEKAKMYDFNRQINT